jgi:hypothetical protein
MKREKYGAKIYTNVGPQTIQCCTRQEANRVRRVIEKWISMDETNEWRELNSLANLARKRIGIPSDQIISEFKRNVDKSEGGNM